MEKIKKEPILFKEKKDCCGCQTCKQICPVQAIELKEDEMGFLYPYINKKKCIKCYLCVKSCSFKK